VVALVAGVGALVLTRGGGEDDLAGDPAASGSYTDGLSSPEPSGTPSTALSKPTPKPTPTPTERRRTVKDVDRGIEVYDDVYVNPAKGWRKVQDRTYAITLGADRKGAVLVNVDPFGYSPKAGLPKLVDKLVAADRMTGVKKGPVRMLRPANSNIASQGLMTYSGRVRQNGVTVSLVARCTMMTGVESIHNVTVTFCVVAARDNPDAAYRDGTTMLASVARSI